MKTTFTVISIILISIMLFSFTGNGKKKNKDGKVTVKIITEKDGVTTIIDTTFNFEGEFKESIISDLLKAKGIDENNIDQKIIKTIILNSDNQEEKNVKIVCLSNDDSMHKIINSCNVNMDSVINCCKINIDSLKSSICEQIHHDFNDEDGHITCKKVCITTNSGNCKNLTDLSKEINIEVNEDGTIKQLIINGENVDSGNLDTDIKIIENNSGEKTIIIKAKAKIEDLDEKEMKKIKSPAAKNNLKIENLNLNPNPNNGKFNLSFTLPEKGNTSIMVLDASGKEVYKENLSDFTGDYNKDINISNGGKGLYFLKVQQENKEINKKIVFK